ncbi:MAG: primosomal protein N' [Alphaproteobacteria bacterium]|nr:primosomal protein N' [Alphaproteobacteria bacterium]
MTDLVEVLLPNALDHGFDYRVPEGMAAPVGTIVTVPLGSKHTLGVVWGAGRGGVDPGKIKSILQVHDEFPPLSKQFRKFLQWTAWYNGAPKGAVIKMALPIADIEKQGRVTASQISAIHHENITIAELSKEQKAAKELLVGKSGEGFHISLLDGVTGSGKTEVYFAAIAEQLARHPQGQVLVLLPEIALSVQWLSRFEERFGVAPVLWHSNVTPARRRAAWQAIATGHARVVVGARSALFLPYPHLSMIVVDEEHDGSYKQEEGVMYHARDMAIARAQHEHFPVVLVSATPSLESVANVQAGKYSEVTLTSRHAEAHMPSIHLIDMRAEKLDRDSFISQPLRTAIADALAQGHQAMLFLNRRGYAPLVLCRHCGHRFQCPHCSAWLVMHQKKRGNEELKKWRNDEKKEFLNSSIPQFPCHLTCHHCDYHIPLPSACPECKSENTLHACGPGVERIFEEITTLMPQARVATLASDSATSHSELSRIIEAMEKREIDILVGTQMIAKGHHFGGLAVVGVVDADLGLSGGDLRAAEKTYQLLHQISGRAGREQVRGHVYLQSYIPDHPVMQALAEGGRDAFFAAELEARKTADMPPFSRLSALIIEGHKEEEVIATTKKLASLTTHHSPLITTYGPAPAPLYMLRGKYRYRFLVKAPRNINLPNYMQDWVEGVKAPRSVRIKIDIDPMSFL